MAGRNGATAMTCKTHRPPGGYVEKPARGMGWGGEAKPAKPFSAEHQATPEAKSAGQAAAKTAREVAVAHAVEMQQLMVEIARNAAAPFPTRLDAASKTIERAEGKAVASVDVTSKGERMGYVIPAPPEAEDAESWATQHQPR